MKRFPVFVFAAAILVSMVACNFSYSVGSMTPTRTPASMASNALLPVTGQVDPTPTPGTFPAGSYIVAVTLAKDVQGEDKTPVNPTDVFGPSDTIHAVVQIQDAPANTTYKSTWYAVDVGEAAPPNTLIDSTELTTDGTRNLDFSLSPSTTWPTGTYMVQIDVNGQPATQVQFTVQ